MKNIHQRILYYKTLPYIYCVLASFLFGGAGFCQSRQDTAKINDLIRQSRALLDRPGSLPVDLDPAFNLASDAERLSRETHYRLGEGNALLTLSDVLSAKGEKKLSSVYAKKALQVFQEYGNRILIARALIAYSGSYDNTQAELPEKIKLYEQAIQIFKDEKADSSVAQLTQFLTNLYMVKGDYQTALAKGNEALHLYKATGYKKLQGLYNLFGTIYSELDSSSLALQYNILAAETGEKLKDSGALMMEIYNWLGISYFKISYYEQAKEYFKKGLAIALTEKDSTSISWIQHNIADVLQEQGHYGEALNIMKSCVEKYPMKDPLMALHYWSLFLRIYVKSGDYKEGKPYYDKLLLYYHTPEAGEADKQAIRILLADYLEKTGHFKEAETYLSMAGKQRKSTPFSTRLWMLFELLSYRLDSARGNYTQAIQHYKLYKDASDSSYNIVKAKQFDQLRLQFETEKKDEDIQLLTNQNELQHAAIEKEKYTKNIVIAGAVMLLLLLIVGYIVLRQKQVSNKRMQASRDQIDKQNENLKKLVREKEWLLKEIHHRVKNNLQIVMSLLNTQSAYLANDDAIRAVKDSQQRMHAMSLIHQRLYQSDHLSYIDLSWYVKELVDYMKDCYSSDKYIRFDLDIDEIQLDIAQSVPLGLILNESISNAMKYAFPGYLAGKIAITIKRVGGNNCFLSVADNGVGLPDGFDPADTDTLGMSLLVGLSEQLGGHLQVHSGQGLSLTVTFRLNGRIEDGIPQN